MKPYFDNDAHRRVAAGLKPEGLPMRLHYHRCTHWGMNSIYIAGERVTYIEERCWCGIGLSFWLYRPYRRDGAIKARSGKKRYGASALSLNTRRPRGTM